MLKPPMSPSMSHSLEKKLDKPEADLQIQPSDEIKTGKRKRTNSVDQLEMPAYENNQMEEAVNEEDSKPPSMNHSQEEKLDKQPEADLQIQPSDEIKTGKRKRTNSIDQLEMPVYENNQMEETVNEEDNNALADDEAEEAGPSDTSRRKGGDPKAVQDYRIIEGKWTSLVDRRWSEKLAELEHEKELIREETHYGYTSGMEEIERRKQQRLSIAHSRKKHHKISSQEQLNSTRHRAYCEFVSGKACWRKEKLSEINSRRWRLKEDKKYLDDFARIVYSLPDRDQIVQSKQIRQINAFELTDVQEQYGFPAAPWIEQMPQSELEYDLSQIGIGLEDEASEGDTPSSSSPPMNPISGPISADDVNDTNSGNNININNSQYSLQTDIVSIEGDQFWLFGKCFKKGDPVLINNSPVGQYAAKFIMGNKHEVVIQRMDGSKTRLQTIQLKEGRCQMQLRDS